MTGSKEDPQQLLRKARMEQMWTQQYVASELAVSIKTVASWENGKRFPSLEMRAKLCKLFDKSPEELGLVKEERSQATISTTGPSMVPLTGLERQHVSLPVENNEKPSRRDKIAVAPMKAPSHTDMVNRQRMLTRVHTFWVAGIFEHSLYQRHLLALSLQEQPAAVLNPWQGAVQESLLPARSFTEGTRIIQVYDQADGELLILGEPGAGKTTLLLELARTLLVRAKRDEQHPIPVVFNLSEWSARRPTLQEWLVEELHAKYQIPTKLAQAWIETEQILLLLDGLDEVAPEYRTACIQAINVYRGTYGLVPMVVCSRSGDYLSQATRLLLNRAIVVQLLTKQQIEKYIAHVGPDLKSLELALEHDPDLQEMASTPLMLNTLTVAYQGLLDEEALTGGSPQVRRQRIFTKYVERVLERRGPKKTYTREQTTHFLGWLARHMQENNLTEFYIERMQPEWLERIVRRSYRDTIVRIVFGLNLLMNAALFGAFMSDSVPDTSGVFLYLPGKGWGNHILGWMAPGLGGGLRGGGSLEIIVFIVDVVAALIVGQNGLPPITLQFLQRVALNGLRNGLLFGGIIAIFTTVLFGVTEGLATGIYRALGTGVFEGLLVGLMTGLMAGLRFEQEHDMPKRQKVFQGRRLMDRAFNFFTFAVCSGIGTASAYALFSGGYLIESLVYGLVVSVACGILFGLGNGTELMPNLGLTIKPAESVAWSWANVIQHLASNVKKGLPIAGTILLLMVVVLGCAGQVYYGAMYSWRYGLVYGSIIGIVTGVAAILTGVLNSGWSSNMIDEKRRMQPNEGTHNSFKNACFAAGLFGTIGAIAGGLTSGLSFLLAGVPGWPALLLGMMVAFGATFAFRFWTAYGGNAFIEHYVLRWYLWREGAIPWKYIRFLDYASERALLRKVGGGYIFAHRLILEHFASLSVRSTEQRREKKKS